MTDTCTICRGTGYITDTPRYSYAMQNERVPCSCTQRDEQETPEQDRARREYADRRREEWMRRMG